MFYVTSLLTPKQHSDSNTRGNEASRSGTDNGDKHIRAIGCILVENKTK